MNLNNEDIHNGVTRAQLILSELTHNILFRPTHVHWYGMKQIAEIKSIIEAVEQHLKNFENENRGKKESENSGKPM